MNSAMKLRPYQKNAIKKIARQLAGPPTANLVVMATGLGKTVLIAEAATKAKKVLVLVHRDELARQAKTEINAWAPHLNVGIEKAEARADRDSDVVVASVQTLGTSMRLHWFEPDLIIVDEAHHAPAATWKRSIERFSHGKPTHVLGFTATPHRETGDALHGEEGALFDRLIVDYGIRDGMRDGWLADLRGYLVKTNIDVSTVKIRMGDYSERDLAEIVDVDTRTATAFKAWQEKAGDRKTLAFCAGIKHAQHTAEFFRLHGVRAECLTSDEQGRRHEILAAFEAGEIQVLTNVGILTEGFNSPSVACILMLRPTKSWTLYTQMIGRGTRKAPGKTDCLVLDVVDATGKHDVCTVPSMAGLPFRTELEGKTLAEAFDEADGAGEMPAGSRDFEGTLAELPMWLQGKVLAEATVMAEGIDARIIEAFDEEKTVAQWLRDPRCVVGRDVFWSRTWKGWDAERALSQPSSDKTPMQDMEGRKFGCWTVIDQAGKQGHSTAIHWRCRCGCGATRIIAGTILRNKKPRGCSRCGRRNASLIEVNGQRLTKTEIARKMGIGIGALQYRLSRGDSVVDIVRNN